MVAVSGWDQLGPRLARNFGAVACVLLFVLMSMVGPVSGLHDVEDEAQDTVTTAEEEYQKTPLSSITNPVVN